MKIIKTNIWVPVVLIPVWFLIYHNLQPVTNWLIDSAFGMTKGAHLTEAVRFFVFEFPAIECFSNNMCLAMPSEKNYSEPISLSRGIPAHPSISRPRAPAQDPSR